MADKEILEEYIDYLRRPGLRESLLTTLKTVLGEKIFKDVSLFFSPVGSSFTDGKSINVSLFDDLLMEEKKPLWNIYLKALTVHEAFHILCSDINDVTLLTEWAESEYEKQGFSGNIGKNIASQIYNVLEDGRIEGIASNRFLGVANAFVILNRELRKKQKLEKKAETGKEEFSHFFGIILSYAKTGYFPEGVSVYKDTELETVVMSILTHIDRAVIAKTSGKCRESAEDLIFDTIPYIAKLLESDEDLRDELANKNSTSDFNGCHGNEEGDGERSPVRRQNDTEEQDQGEPEGCSKGSDKDAEGAESSPGFSEAAPEEMDEEAVKELISSLEEEVEREVGKSAKGKGQSGSDSPGKGELEKLFAAVYNGKPADDFHYIYEKPSAVPLPEDVSAKANLLSREISKVLKAKRDDRRGLRSGKLDIKAYPQTAMGSSDVFYRKGDRKAGGYAVSILIDNSGSMAGNKSFEARKAGAICEEALRLSKVPCRTALFNTQSDGDHHVALRNFDERTKDNSCWSSIKENGISADGYNRDSSSINFAVLELKKRREQNKILFVLSDGTPSAYGSRESATDEVRRAVKKAEKDGIKVIAIMFGDESFMDSCKKDYVHMYGTSILSCKPEDISNKLPALLRSVIKK